MKNLSRRVAALAPSLTVALILFTVGLTALLAYRAFDASRGQERLIERTMSDYSGIAAAQMKNAVMARISGMHARAFDKVLRSINTRGAMPPLGARQLVALVEARRAPLDSISFFFQVTFADSGIDASPSPVATAANLRHLRDTVVAQGRLASRRDVSGPGRAIAVQGPIPVTAQFFSPIFSKLDGRPYIFAHAITIDTSNVPLVAYGYAAPAELVVGEAVSAVLANQAVLPRSLMRGLTADSILGVRVTDPSGQLIYTTNPAMDTRFAATDSLEPRAGGLRFQVSISEAAAGRLIIGGMPRSRLPEVIATAFVAVSLLALLMSQFRRQEELGRLRNDFVSGVSHELRTPLAQIRLLAELLHMGKVPTAEDKDRSLRIIDKEARRLSFLVDSILSFTRTKASELSPVRTDIAAEIAEIVSGFEPLAQAQSTQLTTRLERGLQADVDRGALRQVLLNLLDNAVRYGPAGQTITISTAAVAGDTWTLEVADQGPGVPPDERERIFAPYYRMKRDAGGAVGGTGIGLAVVRQLVEQHGGNVRVSAVDGGPGARFVVTLPCSPLPLATSRPRR